MASPKHSTPRSLSQDSFLSPDLFNLPDFTLANTRGDMHSSSTIPSFSNDSTFPHLDNLSIPDPLSTDTLSPPRNPMYFLLGYEFPHFDNPAPTQTNTENSVSEFGLPRHDAHHVESQQFYRPVDSMFALPQSSEPSFHPTYPTPPAYPTSSANPDRLTESSTTTAAFDGLDEALAFPSLPLAPNPVTETGSADEPVLSDNAHSHRCRCLTMTNSPCDRPIGTDAASIRLHLKQAHDFRATGKELRRCPWMDCSDVLQSENICRHIVTRHLRVKVKCHACGVLLSRKDVKYSHRRSCRGRRFRG